MVVALCILLVGTAIGLKDALWPVFTIKHLGWYNSAYADMVAGANVIGAVVAMVVAGWLADRVGEERIMSFYLLRIGSCWAAIALTPHAWPRPGYMAVFIHAIQFIETFCTVAVFATCMNLCWTRVAATQFTLYMVCNNLGLVVGAMLLGPLREHVGWSGAFFFLAGLVLVPMMGLRFVRLRGHEAALGRLEERFASTAEAVLPRPVGGVVPELGVAG